MASKKLPNYLRTNRKRLALSQDDVAYLLGAESGEKVCRYERFARAPSLETALACEAIFKRPVAELFAGLYERIEDEVAVRAAQLARRADGKKPNPQTARKRESLEDIAARKSKNPQNQS